MSVETHKLDDMEFHVLSTIVDATLAEKRVGELGWITGEWPYLWTDSLCRLCELDLVEQDERDLKWLRATEAGIDLVTLVEVRPTWAGEAGR